MKHATHPRFDESMREKRKNYLLVFLRFLREQGPKERNTLLLRILLIFRALIRKKSLNEIKAYKPSNWHNYKDEKKAQV